MVKIMRRALNRQVAFLETRRAVAEMAREDVCEAEKSIEGIKDLHTWSCLHECAVTTAS